MPFFLAHISGRAVAHHRTHTLWIKTFTCWELAIKVYHPQRNTVCVSAVFRHRFKANGNLSLMSMAFSELLKQQRTASSTLLTFHIMSHNRITLLKIPHPHHRLFSWLALGKRFRSLWCKTKVLQKLLSLLHLNWTNVKPG